MKTPLRRGFFLCAYGFLHLGCTRRDGHPHYSADTGEPVMDGDDFGDTCHGGSMSDSHST